MSKENKYEPYVSVEDTSIWMQKERDPQTERFNEIGARAMAEAVSALRPLSSAKGPPIRLSILTGDRFWYQTAFCLWSFSACSGRRVEPVIMDDGSLLPEQVAALQRLFPELELMTTESADERVSQCLPVGKYPTMRAQHRSNVMMKKLINTHIGRCGWRLNMDSDMLFFRSPEFLIKWCDNPELSLYAEDIMNAYSSPLSYLDELAGRPIRRQVNAGLIGVQSDTIDWDEMEYWAHKLATRGAVPHTLEQTLYALYLTGRDCVIPPPEDYRILPEPPEAFQCRAVMHHYVMHSRKWYLQKNWKRFIDRESSRRQD